MTKDEIQKMISQNKREQDEKFEQLLNKFEHCIITARDSVPPSLSSVIMEMKGEIKELREQQKPLSDAFNMYNGVVNSLYLMAKVFGASGIIITTVYAIKRWILK